MKTLRYIAIGVAAPTLLWLSFRLSMMLTGTGGIGDRTYSPDKKWVATAEKLWRTDFFGNKSSSFRFSIANEATKSIVSQTVIHSLPRPHPDLGDRSQRFSFWATNSTSAQFVLPTTNIVLVVPVR